MPELQTHPGIQFYVLKLEGTLRYHTSRNGKLVREYEISDADFDEIMGIQVKEESVDTYAQGIHASAVGLQLQLIKNDGRLSMEFEGKNGGHASWVFDGLEEHAAGRIYATVETQTELRVMQEAGMQTLSVDVSDAQVQTEIGTRLGSAKVQMGDAGFEVLHSVSMTGWDHIPSKNRESLDLASVKRNSADSDQSKNDKSARAETDTASFDGLPRHILQVVVRKDSTKVGPGRLHIDMKERKIEFQDNNGAKLILNNDCKALWTMNPRFHILQVARMTEKSSEEIFRSVHSPKVKPYGNQCGGHSRATSITSDEFLNAFRKCLISS